MTGAHHLRVLGLSVVAAFLLVAPAANAAIAGGSPSNFTDRPTLTSVTVREDHVFGVKTADFYFDRSVDLGPAATHGFHLVGYSAYTWNESTSAAVEFGAHNAVRATFNVVGDIVNATIGTVDANAVVGATGSYHKGNLADSAPLGQTQQGMEIGNTVGPNIVRVTVDPTLNQIDVTYDRVVKPYGLATGFHYYDQAGNRVDATKAVNAGSPAGNTLVVTFPASLSHSVRDAVRLGVDEGAVRDAANQPQPLQSAAILYGGETARPDLVGAMISGVNSIDYTFDEPVKLADATKFVFYTPNLGAYTGVTATPLNTNTHTVRVWFGPAAQDVFRNGLVLAGVREGAVKANDSAALANTIGAIGIGSLPHTSGYTSAPDAMSVVFNKDDGTATIAFDQEIGATPASVWCPKFHLYDNSGNELIGPPSFGKVVAGVDGSVRVTLLFGEDRVENAQAVGLEQGAVIGQTGDPAVPQVIARTLPAPKPVPAPSGGGGGGGTQPTGTTPSTPVTTPAPVTPSAVVVVPVTSPKATVKITYAKLRTARSWRSVRVLRLRVEGTSSTATVRIRVVNRAGKFVRGLTRTVHTNRTVNITVGRLMKGQHVSVRIV